MSDPLDDEIDRLAHAFADETDGRSETSDETLAAILATPRARRATGNWWLAAAAAFVIAIGTPTAWAWWTGRLEAETTHDVQPPRSATPPPSMPAHARSPRPEPEAPLAPVPTPDPTEPATTREAEHEHHATRATTRELPELPAPVAEEVFDVPQEAVEEEAPVDTSDRRAYEAAHALHFGAHDPDAALAAWDRYLAEHPTGRFVVEARYNRALTLVRLGRRDDARAALASFADGDHGAYRQHEARALIEAMEPAP